ncbi:MAG: thermonuclease family protein [Candidatus Auribacterota bacterium]|nr:thermonuclease family protein [Candidatus Auribacterota bacterium]
MKRKNFEKRYRPSYNRKAPSIIAAILGIFVVIVFAIERNAIYDRIAERRHSGQSDFSSLYIKEVVDGDTLRIESGKRIRLIGVDTPEYYESDKLFRDAKDSSLEPSVIQSLGERSYRFTQKLCEGKYVRLETGSEKYDQYGRILAFVFLSDGTMLNEQIIAQGYGLVYLRFPFKQEYRDRFIEAQRQARENSRGLWDESPGLGGLTGNRI